MTIRICFLVAVLSAALGACSIMPKQMIAARLGLPEQGFVTHAVFADDAPVPAGRCGGNGCGQAPGFCTARGYTPDTPGFRRCIASVEENLRQQSR